MKISARYYLPIFLSGALISAFVSAEPNTFPQCVELAVVNVPKLTQQILAINHAVQLETLYPPKGFNLLSDPQKIALSHAALQALAPTENNSPTIQNLYDFAEDTVTNLNNKAYDTAHNLPYHPSYTSKVEPIYSPLTAKQLQHLKESKAYVRHLASNYPPQNFSKLPIDEQIAISTFLSNQIDALQQYPYPKDQDIGILFYETLMNNIENESIVENKEAKARTTIPTCNAQTPISTFSPKFNGLIDGKSYFYHLPINNTQEKAYLIDNNPVILSQEYNGWRCVRYNGSHGVYEGWMPALNTSVVISQKYKMLYV